MLMTDQEIKELTGRKYPAYQTKWLKEHRFK